MLCLTGNEALDRQLMRNLNLDQDLGWWLLMASVRQLILDTVGWLVVPIIGWLVLAEVFDSGTTVIEVVTACRQIGT